MSPLDSLWGLSATLQRFWLMGLLSYLTGPRTDPHRYVPEPLLAKSLAGHTVLITGGNGVFGKTIAEQLCTQGAKVVIAARRLAACEAVATEINGKGLAGEAFAAHLDLASLEGVRAFAARFTAEHDALHILIENAAVNGVANVPTVDGFEPTLGINHYGHLLLRHELEPLLAASAPSRVVTVASALHDRLFTQEPTTIDLDAPASHLGWTDDPKTTDLQQWMAYARSKLANVLSAKAAAPRLASKGVSIVSVHPGVDVTTGLFRAWPTSALVMGLFGRLIGVQTTWQSVQTILFCALEDANALEPGGYYSQYYNGAYRNGATAAAWPMRSPNPLVTEANATKLEALSYAAVGINPPKQQQVSTAGGSGGLGELDVATTPQTAEVIR